MYEFIGTHTNYSVLSELLNALLKNGRRKLSAIRFAHLFILKHYITSDSLKIHMKESDSTVKQRAMRGYLMKSQIQQYLHYNLPERKPY